MKNIIIIFLSLIIVGGAAFYLGKYGLSFSKPGAVSTQATPEITFAISTPVPTVTAVPVDEKSVLIKAIGDALVVEHGPDAAGMNVTVSTLQGNFSKGMAGGSGGGGIWFAAKVGEVWKLVWDGNGTIQCSDLTNYPDFPNSMISECWDMAKNGMISR